MEKNSLFRVRLRTINSLLLVAFAFIIPMWIAPAYILSGLIMLLLLVQGDFKNDYYKIRENKLVWALIAYFLLHVVGLLWTSNTADGLNKVARASLFLLVPVFMLSLKKEHVKLAIWSFLASMMLSCLLSFIIYFQVDPVHFKFNSQGDPIIFISRVYYSLYLVMAIAFSLYYFLFYPSAGKGLKIVSFIVTISLVFDLFICNGRAGQVILFFLLVIVVFQYFGKRWLRAFVAIIIAIPLLFLIAFKTVKPFQDRVQLGIEDIVQYQTNQATSLGQRFVYAKNSFEIFYEHPLLGVGTGDFEDELLKKHQKNNAKIRFDVDPHNMFLLEMGQFGVLGLISLLSILYAQISIALRSNIPMQKYLGLSLPIMFGAVMMSDIYLQLHFTAMLFILVSAIVYRSHLHDGQYHVSQ
jgi:O-antigen ligase